MIAAPAVNPRAAHPWRPVDEDAPRCMDCHMSFAETNDGKLCRSCLRKRIWLLTPSPPRDLSVKWTEMIGRPCLGTHALAGTAEVLNDEGRRV